MFVNVFEDDDDEGEQRPPPVPVYSPVNYLDEFFRRFRFNRQGIDYLAELLGEELGSMSDRGRPLPMQVSVVAALRYLCTADRQLDVADTLHISQPSVSRIIAKVIDGLNERKNRFIRFPTEPAAVRRNQHEFHAMAGFPNVVALVDGTHIPIQPPAQNEHVRLKRSAKPL